MFFGCLGKSSQKHPRKLTWQWNNNHWKMYLLLNIGIFRCHLSFQGCMLGLHLPWICDLKMLFENGQKQKVSQMVVKCDGDESHPMGSVKSVKKSPNKTPSKWIGQKPAFLGKQPSEPFSFHQLLNLSNNHQKSGGIPTKNGYKCFR